MRDLSKREREVLNQAFLGKSNKQIAAALGITEGTVKIYFYNLKQATGIGRTSAVKWVARDLFRQKAVELDRIMLTHQMNPELRKELSRYLAEFVPEVLNDYTT